MYLPFTPQAARTEWDYPRKEAVTDTIVERLVPNDQIRAAVDESGLTFCEIARRCGWYRKDGRPYDDKVRAATGHKAQQTKVWKPDACKHCGRPYKVDSIYLYRNKRTRVSNVIAIAEALGLDPVDFGV
jgi:hypothetical protein